MRLIYDYKSFRTFLKDYYLQQKEKNPSFSYGIFAKQVGLSSPAHIQLILSGKRGLTVSNIHKMGEALALPRPELEYFEVLVHQNQSQTPSERKYYDQRLSELGKDLPATSTRLKVSHLLSEGILPALFLSIDGRNYQTALGAGERFGYNRSDTAIILKQLQKEQVITLENDVVRISQRHLILHDKKNQSHAQKQFLSRQLKLSLRAFERMYEKEGKFFAYTFTMNPERFSIFTDELKAFMGRMSKLSDENDGDAVMQLNIQLFPYEKTLTQTKDVL